MKHSPAETPSLILAPDTLAALRRRDRVAIVAIAGRDSIAAAVAAVRAEGFSAVLPSVVATGTEVGDETAPFEAVALLRDLVGDRTDVLEPVRIGSPALWAALNARYSGEIAKRFGSGSPCLACHLYVHLARVPLAWALGGVPVVTGERDTHDGRIKLSQTSLSIDAETRVLAHAGIRMLAPVRHLSGAQIDELVDGRWPGFSAELGCLHSGNYRGIDGSVCYDEAGYERYVSEYLEPVGLAVVDAWRSDPQPDYVAVVADVLSHNRD